MKKNPDISEVMLVAVAAVVWPLVAACWIVAVLTGAEDADPGDFASVAVMTMVWFAIARLGVLLAL